MLYSESPFHCASSFVWTSAQRGNTLLWHGWEALFAGDVPVYNVLWAHLHNRTSCSCCHKPEVSVQQPSSRCSLVPGFLTDISTNTKRWREILYVKENGSSRNMERSSRSKTVWMTRWWNMFEWLWNERWTRTFYIPLPCRPQNARNAGNRVSGCRQGFFVAQTISHDFALHVCCRWTERWMQRIFDSPIQDCDQRRRSLHAVSAG